MTAPLSEKVTVTRSTVNRRHYFERASRWPEGLVVIGDAVATYNPLYGQGMTVAAQGLVALRDILRTHDLGTPTLARRIQCAIARPAAVAWELATAQDILYPGAQGQQPRPGTGLANRYVDRVVRAATGRAQVTRAFLGVITMSEPVTSWMHPDVVVGALRGPGRKPLSGPPLTEMERAVAAGRHGQAPEPQHSSSR